MKILPASRFPASLLAAFALLTLAACTTGPKVTDVWTAPDLTKISFKKIMVIAATQDGGVRRMAEDAMGAAIPSVMCVPSYAMLPGDADIKEAAKITESLKAAAFDGIVVMRMISDRNEVNVSQDVAYPGYGAYPVGYRSFGGYYGRYAMGGYGYGTGMGYSTTTVTTDRIISIETNIYEFPGEKLVWSGVTAVTSPKNIQELISAAVGAVRNELVKQKFIPEPAK